MTDGTHVPDPWSPLRRHTSARIALGRAGGSLPTGEVLNFAIAHAAARDAVHAELDTGSLLHDLSPLGLDCLLLATQATDRETYLQRPDLGRGLDESSRGTIAALPRDERDIAFIIGDGLSAPAAQRQSLPLLAALLPLLRMSQMIIAPLCIVRHARVAVEDEIGLALRAKIAVMLIGERPGLSTAESLGVYLVFDPKPGRTDAERNCVSNIRTDGLSPAAAAETLIHLIMESLRRRISGVQLKDDRPERRLTDSQHEAPPGLLQIDP
jgi:ethanolamine ammonia-lyase small subunit